MAQHIEELEERINGVKEILVGIRQAVGRGSDLAILGKRNITQAEDIIKRAREALTVSLQSSWILIIYI